MPDIASWNGHKFVVNSRMIASFRELTIKGSCETTDKTANNQKYMERKNGEATQIVFVVELNALTGVKNVYGEAMKYVDEARNGKTDYLYLGSSKAGKAKMMLVSAEVQEIVFANGKGNKWVSCEVKLTMKQGSQTESGGDSSSDSGGGGGGSDGYTCTVYYCGDSGAISNVKGQSKVSYADAKTKAFAKVPGTAKWAGTKKSEATQQQTPGKPQKAIDAGKEASQEKVVDLGSKGWSDLTKQSGM